MMADDSSQSRVTSWDVSVEDLPMRVLTYAGENQLLLLPDKTINGVEIYRDDAAGLVKTLQHHGVEIDFASAREDRRYLSEYGASDVVAVIALATASNLTSDLIKAIALTAWYRARSALGVDVPEEVVDSANVTVKIAEIVKNDRETVIRGLEITGPAANIEAGIRNAIAAGGLNQLPSGNTDGSNSEDSPE
ncbi:hypothetical protein [Actinacidiphila alni]|uniref:hypothetical protein n=1 Tax=Actinacidiphila alni TaxID=380248 RepID=UPI003456821D